MTQSTLGSCFRTLRMQYNLTRLQLAELLGVTDKAVSKWERDLSYPDIASFPKLADILGTTDFYRQAVRDDRPISASGRMRCSGIKECLWEKRNK